MPSILNEVYASKPVNQIVLETLELHNPNFTNELGINVPFRFVCSKQSLTPINGILEESAPRDGGKFVEFLPAPISVTPSGESENGKGDINITLGDVTHTVEEQLNAAVQDGYNPVRVFHRIYTLNIDTGAIEGAHNHPFERHLKSCSMQAGIMSATASVVDIINKPFPFNLYTAKFAPALTN
ncbi:hypothetical protein AB832_07325 [Flavobacteriaceae bacterium (ex Bugula neritina AB1)]|nr:hypothetical protein AB832_07325 [Flavobacteriaceae bacterium (ex Bugula neritina AB1)]